MLALLFFIAVPILVGFAALGPPDVSDAERLKQTHEEIKRLTKRM